MINKVYLSMSRAELIAEQLRLELIIAESDNTTYSGLCTGDAAADDLAELRKELLNRP